MSAGRVIIVGAGPCGIACAREMVAEGHTDVLVLEDAAVAGGLAASFVDPAGFTWDRGGHVVFSHYGEFDSLLDEVMGDDVNHHDRSSFIRIADSWVAYPFQNNLHHLPADLAQDALLGLVEARTTPADPSADADFGTWMLATFGPGICDQFMRPYNEKVWAWPASTMNANWIAERVAVPDWRQAVANVVHRRDDVAWGPNNRFAFPIAGGTGEIYRRAAATVDAHIRYGSAVRSVDVDERVVVLEDGSTHGYDTLIWTGALDLLVRSVVQAPDELRAAADQLVHNSVTVVGVGYESPVTDEASWLYFPEPDVPFYRASNFAKYAPANVPGSRTDVYSSWMTEIASSPYRPLDTEGLGERVDAGIRHAGLVEDGAAVVSVHIDHIPYAYPVPSLGRDAALRTIQPWLMERSVFSRGRFGAWRYEIGNMDHSVKQGVDVARRVLHGQPEEAWFL